MRTYVHHVVIGLTCFIGFTLSHPVDVCGFENYHIKLRNYSFDPALGVPALSDELKTDLNLELTSPTDTYYGNNFFDGHRFPEVVWMM